MRVFVSSTFTDMKAERDYLVKFTFPQLRKLCESRGVTWGEVDFRWGVTDEEKAEGKVLPIVLAEIERCQRYFIGMLGERYGQPYNDVSADLVERFPWLREHPDKSLTELEILHGVLNDEGISDRAFFYFRDPAYSERMTRAARADFVSDDSASREKLTALKDRIRQRHRDKRLKGPPRENYANPEALGQLILEDFTQLIDEIYPEGSQPDPLDREAADHEAFAQSRARVYIGRNEYFQKLDDYVGQASSLSGSAGIPPASESQNLPLVILGESGSGKSALLANWALRHRGAHPGDLLLLHFIGGSPYSSDWAAMLRRIMGEFKRRFGIVQDIPDQPDALRAAFANWLHMAAAKGRVILILDALNQLEDRDGAPDFVWLPPVMPENVRLIVSTLPGRALDEVNKRRWPVLHVQALDPAERQQVITCYLAQYTKALSPARAARIAEAPQSANPLYLRALLEELRLFGEHERLDDRITHYLQAGTVPELYEKILARWEADYADGTGLVRDAMTLLWAARRGLTEAELLHALGEDCKPPHRAMWSPLFLAAGDSLVSRSGLLTFFHDYLRGAVRNAYVPSENHQRDAHMRLADYFELQPASPRQLDELPWQLTVAAAWPRLCKLLSDLPFLDALWQASKFDAKTCWARLEDNAFRMVDAYRPLLESPDRFDPDQVLRISILLADAGHPVEALFLCAHLVDHFRRNNDRASLGACLGSQAVILYSRGDLDGAMALLGQQEQLCHELGDSEGLTRMLGNQALILKARGDWDGAMALHKREEQICRELGDKDGLSTCLGNQGVTLKTKGDLEGAMALHKQEELICRELGNKDGLHRTFGNQAGILQARGELDGAMALHKEEEQICRELGYKDGLRRTLGNQALILTVCGDLHGAIELHKQEELICRELGNRDGLQASLGNQAAVLIVRSDLNGAMALLKQKEQICRELGNKDVLQGSFINQGAIRQIQGDLDSAMTLFKQAEQICRETGSKEGLMQALLNQAVTLQARGDSDGAMALFKYGEQLCRELGNKGDLSTCLGNLANILAERGDWEGAMPLYKQEEQICRELDRVEGLARSLFNQAILLTKTSQPREALPLMEQAYWLAKLHGLISLAQQIQPALKHVRQAALQRTCPECKKGTLKIVGKRPGYFEIFIGGMFGSESGIPILGELLPKKPIIECDHCGKRWT
jgi:tetratricopeptide (TPR) repeat protein